jgi:hypothetical protein
MTRPGWHLYGLWASLGLLLAACPSGNGNGLDSSRLVDLAVADQRTGDLAPGDLAPGDLAPSDLSMTDLGADDAAPADVLLSQGPCSGRAGHACSGIITLYRTPGDALQLRFPSNFSVTPIPAGEVYLSSRSALGSTIDPNTDVFLGTLQAFTGAQSYAVPAGAEVGRPYAWIWCRRVTVEVGVALLTPQP